MAREVLTRREKDHIPQNETNAAKIEEIENAVFAALGIDKRNARNLTLTISRETGVRIDYFWDDSPDSLRQ